MKKKRFVNTIIIISMICIAIYLGIQLGKEASIRDKSEYNAQNLGAEYSANEIENNIFKNSMIQYPKAEIITKYKGYGVLAKLEIPEIKLETYILKKCTEESLNKAVAKYWGADPNTVGNLCVAGHNAPRNRNMFYHLKDLKIGDKLTISDNTVGIVEYEIYDIFKVSPDDVSSLEQETGGNKEVTLITCTNDSKKRLIVKAREIINYE